MKKVDLPQPTLLLAPFCSNGTKNTIPLVNSDSSNPQLADLTNGFPLKTQGSPDDGNLPPERADFNGLGNLTTTYDFFYQAGGTFTFNSTISTAIGGYPKDARLWYTNDSGISMILRSTIDDNIDNFNTTPSCIGSTWVVESFAGVENSSVELLDYKFSDKLINNMNWILSDGSWLSGSTYTDVLSHLKEDIAFFPTNTPSIVVSNTGDFTNGTYVRDSSKDEVSGTTTYYGWTYNTTTFYLTIDIDSMSGSDAFSAIQGQRIYKKEDGSFYLTKHKVVKIESETVDNNGTTLTLTVWVGSDGHRIVDVTAGTDQETAVSAIYTQTGVAWYYLLDVANSKFKLPIENLNRLGLPQSVPVSGNEMMVGFTDGLYTGFANINTFGYTPSTSPLGTSVGVATSNAPYSNKTVGLTTDATKSGIVARSELTENAYDGRKYLYFYVGLFNQSAIEQTAGITATTINGKADVDLRNITSQAKEDIAGFGMPDYTSGVTISSNYEAVSNGYLRVQAYINDGTAVGYIDNIEVYRWKDDGNSHGTSFIPIAKGSIWTCSVGFEIQEFYPCLGG